MRRVLFLGLVLLAAFAALVWAGNLGLGPVLITREDEQKIVLMFGSPRLVSTEPGIRLRLPFVTDVIALDKRRLYLNAKPERVQTKEQESVVIDDYVIWRITDPVLYYKSFPQGRSQAEAQIDRVVRGDLREVIGRRSFVEVVTLSRSDIMGEVTKKSGENLRRFGVQVEDVRINRTELPDATLESVYARMRAERERLARKARAEGEEEGRRLRAEADRDARVVTAEAQRDATQVRGEGDAEAARIYAESYGADPDFYRFVRSLEAYRKTIGEGTTLVLSPSSDFFRVLGGDGHGSR